MYVLVLHLSSSLLKNRRMTKKSRPLTPELSPSKSPGLKMIHAGPDLDGLIILRRPRFHLRGVQLAINWLIFTRGATDVEIPKFGQKPSTPSYSIVVPCGIWQPNYRVSQKKHSYKIFGLEIMPFTCSQVRTPQQLHEMGQRGITAPAFTTRSASR